MQEFRKTLALLLPNDTFHHSKIVAMSRAPAPLKEVEEDCDSGQMAMATLQKGGTQVHHTGVGPFGDLMDLFDHMSDHIGVVHS